MRLTFFASFYKIKYNCGAIRATISYPRKEHSGSYNAQQSLTVILEADGARGMLMDGSGMWGAGPLDSVMT